ncbi:hypothetical protein Dsin_005732 [Dipteronia sinensis]|uniref:Uncharacterized protein n=1 Tax=Dipteronia sinensis TaxID=43782 RepID=A0AAE0AY34_9ROSI|nr:hypothetical protein Dsin_005732 [Dipteronia sinensis]
MVVSSSRWLSFSRRFSSSSQQKISAHTFDFLSRNFSFLPIKFQLLAQNISALTIDFLPRKFQLFPCCPENFSCLQLPQKLSALNRNFVAQKFRCYFVLLRLKIS